MSLPPFEMVFCSHGNFNNVADFIEADFAVIVEKNLHTFPTMAAGVGFFVYFNPVVVSSSSFWKPRGRKLRQNNSNCKMGSKPLGDAHTRRKRWAWMYFARSSLDLYWIESRKTDGISAAIASDWGAANLPGSWEVGAKEVWETALSKGEQLCVWSALCCFSEWGSPPPQRSWLLVGQVVPLGDASATAASSASMLHS